MTTPRRVAIPLLSKVEAEIKKIEKLGVIVPVEEPTEWCSGMVVVPKPNGQVRICVDLTKASKENDTHYKLWIKPLLNLQELRSSQNWMQTQGFGRYL